MRAWISQHDDSLTKLAEPPVPHRPWTGNQSKTILPWLCGDLSIIECPFFSSSISGCGTTRSSPLPLPVGTSPPRAGRLVMQPQAQQSQVNQLRCSAGFYFRDPEGSSMKPGRHMAALSCHEPISIAIRMQMPQRMEYVLTRSRTFRPRHRFMLQFLLVARCLLVSWRTGWN